MRRFRPLFLAALLGLGACRVPLHDDLSQGEANAMAALLIEAGIDASREAERGGLWSVAVPEADFPRAVALIRNAGLPRPAYASLPEVLGEGGLIASPLEERARLHHAAAQELSRTLAELDAVSGARVHVATGAVPLTASVVIRHRGGFGPDAVPLVQRIVADAVDGLSAERVTVALFAGAVQAVPPRRAGGTPWPWWLAGLAVLGAAAAFLWHRRG